MVYINVSLLLFSSYFSCNVLERTGSRVEPTYNNASVAVVLFLSLGPVVEILLS